MKMKMKYLLFVFYIQDFHKLVWLCLNIPTPYAPDPI